MTKTNKSLSKRVKISGSGKILKRPPHQNHFNAKDNGKQTRRKRGFTEAPSSINKNVKFLIN